MEFAKILSNDTVNKSQLLEQLFDLAVFKQEMSVIDGLSSEEIKYLTRVVQESSPNKIITFFKIFQSVFFGRQDVHVAIKEINQRSSGMGVCAKAVANGEYVWKCRNCQMDENAIQCGECFSTANHEGHDVQYFKGGGGCCDCGDFDYFREEGSCKNHKGFEASKEAMLNSMPAHIKTNGQQYYSTLAKCFKKLLLAFQASQDDEQMKQVCELLGSITSHCQEVKSVIYFVSHSFIEIIFVPKEESHECCHRYFFGEAARKAYEHQSKNLTPDMCTCSLIDLLCQTNKLLLGGLKTVTKGLMFTLFQSQAFKMNLGMAYAANIHDILEIQETESLMAASVQCFPLVSCSMEIVRDPELPQILAQALDPLLHRLILNPVPLNYGILRHYLYDLYSIDKPQVGPILALETDLLPITFSAVKRMYFEDEYENPEEMQQFETAVDLKLLNAELDLCGKLERYLQYVIRNEDIKRVLMTFMDLFEVLDEQFQSMKGKGFFMMPIHRLFSYFINRVLIKAYIEAKGQDHNFNFHQVLAHYLSPVQMQQLTQGVMTFMSTHQGFIAEIKSKKWIYKGEQFQRLPLIKLSAFKEYFLVDLSLLQMMTVASQRPADAIDTLIANFGTDIWLGILVQNITQEQQDGSATIAGTAGFNLRADLFKNVPRFDVVKLGSQIRQLLLQLIHMCIFETSFLQNLKHLFNFEEQSETQEQKAYQAKLEQMNKGHLRHVLLHHLFLFGATSSIDQIKKAIDPLYTKSEHFMPTLIEISDKTTDADGKIKFRLKEDSALLATFDPYLIVQEKQQSMQQEAYDSLHKKRPCLNDIVGDYQHHYKYQTSVNSIIEAAVANSHTSVKLVTALLKLCFEVVLGMTDNNEKEFFEKLFNSSLMNAALKVQLIIARNVTQNDLISYIRRNLSVELLVKMVQRSENDEKLKGILLHLQKLVHPPNTEDIGEETKEGNPIAGQKESAEAKKAAMLKKKQLMMQKMKEKQQNFIEKKDSKEDKMEVDNQAINQNEVKITCAACQETCDFGDYWKKPFVQMGYATSSKLLYHSYRQTYESQKQSLNNQRAAAKGKTNVMHVNPDEETKETPKNINEKPDDWKEKEIEMVSGELGLKSAIDYEHQTGVALSKCCHYFHYDCLLSYLTSETTQLTFAQVRMRSIVGIDHGQIQCPFCKGIKNTWIPVLPLRSNPDPVTRRNEQEMYIAFFNQLIQTQLNNKGNCFDAKRGIPKEIILVDFQQDPVKFINHIMSATTHLLLSLSSIRSNLLWNTYDPQVQSDDICLRDIVVILLSVRQLVTAIGKSSQEISESLIGMIQADQLCEEESFFGKNFSKTIVKLVFATCMVVNGSSQSDLLIDAIFQSLFSSFKTALAIGHCFRRNNGEITLQKLKQDLQIITQIDEEMIQSCLQFLRTATACKLVVQAVQAQSRQLQIQSVLGQDLTKFIESTFMPAYELKMQTDETQCGLDITLMQLLRQQVDDLQEFKVLTQFLKFDLSLKGMQCKPNALEELEVSLSKANDGVLVSASCIDSIKSAVGLDLQIGEMLTEYAGRFGNPKDENTLMQMPANLLLMTPYFTFNFIDLPGDYQKLVKDYYNRKCRYCKTQVQKNAICILCGEVLCLVMKDQCCVGQPGQLEIQLQQSFFDSTAKKHEGELSYHARVAEGGCSIFVVPSTAEIYMVDDGRVTKYDSFYRSALGETFSEHSTKKWENFFLDEKTGGTRILENLKKLYVANKVGQKVMELRLKHESVVLRHVI